MRQSRNLKKQLKVRNAPEKSSFPLVLPAVRNIMAGFGSCVVEAD